MIYKVQIGSVEKVYEGTPEEIAALIAKLETIDQQTTDDATLDPSVQGETKLSCSFCGKPRNEVKNLVVDGDVGICDACIEMCSELIKLVNTEGETP